MLKFIDFLNWVIIYKKNTHMWKVSFNQFQQYLYLNLNAVARVKTFTRPEMFLMLFYDEIPQIRYKHCSDSYFC